MFQSIIFLVSFIFLFRAFKITTGKLIVIVNILYTFNVFSDDFQTACIHFRQPFILFLTHRNRQVLHFVFVAQYINFIKPVNGIFNGLSLCL